MDEWFMAGDQRFQDKAKNRLEGMVDAAEILIVTSHSLPVLRKWCTRILWMEGAGSYGWADPDGSGCVRGVSGLSSAIWSDPKGAVVSGEFITLMETDHVLCRN